MNMEKLLNVKNERDGRVVAHIVEGPPNILSEKEIREANSKILKVCSAKAVMVEIICCGRNNFCRL